MRNKPLKGVEAQVDNKRSNFTDQSPAKSNLSSGRMKQRPSPKHKSRINKAKNQQRQVEDYPDEMLGIIVDQRSGQTYYISLIDNFTYKSREYAVMYNYRIEDGNIGVPEILIMRSYRDQDKQYFTSIRNQEELDKVFDIFYDRFQQSV